MKLQKRILLATTFALMTAPVTSMASNVIAQEWQPRTIEQVKVELEINEENQTVYTIQYGDTLGVIAEALDIEVDVLGSINAIADLDLIFPGAVLTTTYDENQNAATVMIETADSENEAEINLAENELVVNNETYELPATEEVAEPAAAPVYLTEPVAEWVPETTEAETTVAEETQTPAEETTMVEETEAPVEETTVAEVPVVETTEVAPETTTVEIWVTETTEASVEVTESVVEETSAEVTEIPVTEETTAEVVEETEAPVVEETTEYYEETVVEETEAPVVEETTEYYEEVTEAPVVEETTEYYEEVTEAPIYDPSSDGLQAHVAQFKNEVANAYGITSFSTYRPGDGGDHGQGLAVDFMVPVGSALGDQIAQYAISQIGSSKISYVIWNQQIYGDWNMAWEMMEDRGSITANHMDHVHVSFYP